VGRGGRPYHDGVGLWTRDNVCAYWGMGKNNLPFVLVEDVVDALVRVLQRDGLQGEIFNLVGDVRLSAREYLDALRDHSGRNIKSFPYPIRLLFISDSFKYMIKLAIGEYKNALLSYRDLINRAIIADFDCSKAKNILGWRPCEVHEEFIRNAISWAFEKAEPCFIDHTGASDPILTAGGEQ
jgi:nucleoside-diphosphate-sugar epimerase